MTDLNMALTAFLLMTRISGWLLGKCHLRFGLPTHNMGSANAASKTADSPFGMADSAGLSLRYFWVILVSSLAVSELNFQMMIGGEVVYAT